MSDEEGDTLTDEDDRRKDEELMLNLMQGIETLKKERPPTPVESPEPEEPSETPRGECGPPKKINLDSLSIDELRALLNEVNESLELNSQLQGMLLMKEVKLLAIKRQITSAKSQPQKYRKEEQRIDVGRYYVQFKAPYFKNNHNFAGYVVVPENQLPVTAQRYETKGGQWNKNALKDLEANVRTFLTAGKFREMMKTKPKTAQEKEKIINTYTFLRKHASLASLVGSDFEDTIDWCSIASKLRKDFSPNECQKAWNIFLRPEINKKKWTVAEKEKLKKVALEHNYQDWDAIAADLGTNRNGYQCFHLYVDKIMKLAEGDWSVAEEDFLTKLVKECTYGNKVMWHKVAYFFETRTMTQIYRKWTLSCVGKEVVAGAFTEEEDKTIMEMLIVRKGEFSIGQVAKKLNRISSQIRYRFAQLKSSLKHKYGEWSLEEDKLLMDLVEKFGKKRWSKIAEHMPERGRVQIRHRYTNLRKRFAKNPELSLETLSRFKRPVHSKRKETNLKCLMELSGMEEPQDESLHTVEHLIGPTLKKNEKEALEPMAPLSPCRFPEIDEDALPDDDFDVPDIPLSEQEAPSGTKPKRPKPGRASSEEAEPIRGRSADLHGPIVDHYNMTSEFYGDPVKPPQGPGSRKRPKPENLNAILKFVPYKYFDANAEWTVNADRTDPYYSEVFSVIEKTGDDDHDVTIPDHRLLPPSLTNFQAFYNLLVDMGITEEDLLSPDDKIEKEMAKLYCPDEETRAAIERWEKRITTLFAWPAALSGISLETEDPEESEEPLKGPRKAKTKLPIVKTEPVDEEGLRNSNLGSVD